MFKSDITFKEVGAPMDNWCASGHCASKTFKRGGADSEPEPTKFFKISGKDINDTYCEPCAIIANYIGVRKRNKLKELGVL